MAMLGMVLIVALKRIKLNYMPDIVQGFLTYECFLKWKFTDLLAALSYVNRLMRLHHPS